MGVRAGCLGGTGDFIITACNLSDLGLDVQGASCSASSCESFGHSQGPQACGPSSPSSVLSGAALTVDRPLPSRRYTWMGSLLKELLLPMLSGAPWQALWTLHLMG